MSDRVRLGIDTGGTSTDAVLVTDDRHGHVIATAKRPTTHDDLTRGIGAAIGAVAAEPSTASRIGLVSVSTTLATNAIVEGHGGPVCLITMGFEAEDLARADLQDALGDGIAVAIDGGHTSHGEELHPLDLPGLDTALEQIDLDPLVGFAVVGHFAVRNRSHEEAVRAHLRQRFDVAVTCSHELTANLNGPKRAVTSVLNARLVGLISRLIDATRQTMIDREIDAPLMVVRGDGSLISAELAMDRPIETILSGPAASVTGAQHLSRLTSTTGERLDRALVADIGGTTTDIAVIEDGTIRLRPEGASVAGHDTMVLAADIHTIALGGDSEVRIDDDGGAPRLRLGPRRLIPVSVAATRWPEIVGPVLADQRADGTPHHLSGSFAILRRPSAASIAGTAHERAVLDDLVDGPMPLRRLLPTRRHEIALDRLVRAGVIDRVGFTPTDASHVLGLHDEFDADAARQAATLLARIRARHGGMLVVDAEDLAARTIAALEEQTIDAVLAVALDADDLDPSLATHPILRAGLDHRRGHLRFDLALATPMVALGASATTYYPAIGERLGTTVTVPADAGVANAVGAAVGTIQVRRQTTITRKKNGTFMADGVAFPELDQAVAGVVTRLGSEVRALAERAGAADIDLSPSRVDNSIGVGGVEVFVDTTITVTATGRPRTTTSPAR